MDQALSDSACRAQLHFCWDMRFSWNTENISKRKYCERPKLSRSSGRPPFSPAHTTTNTGDALWTRRSLLLLVGHSFISVGISIFPGARKIFRSENVAFRARVEYAFLTSTMACRRVTVLGFSLTHRGIRRCPT
jgi:hypothetical protein